MLDITKAYRIEHSVPGYDVDKDLSIDNDDDSTMMNTMNQNETKLDPLAIVSSGLKNLNTINAAMNFLHIWSRFTTALWSTQTKSNDSFSEEICNTVTVETNILINDNTIRKSNIHNDKLLKIWKDTITARKAIWNNNDNASNKSNDILSTQHFNQENTLFNSLLIYITLI